MPRELLFSVTKDDFKVQTFCSGGPGGQHQNKVESGVRLIHKESGAVGESRSERSQHTNKKLAFDRLIKSTKFQLWIKRKTHEVLTGKTIEQKVEEMVQSDFLKVEIMDDGNKWTTVDFDTLKPVEMTNPE